LNNLLQILGLLVDWFVNFLV